LQKITTDNKIEFKIEDRFQKTDFAKILSFLFFLCSREIHVIKCKKKFKEKKSEPLEVTNDQVLGKEWMRGFLTAKIS